MTKKLEEMSLKELWELFPIVLTEHQPCWEPWYILEEKGLLRILKTAEIVRISHVGSTAIPEIWAKPIIDIMIEIGKEEDMNRIAEILMQYDYLLMSQSTNRKSLNKGYTEVGFAEKIFHLHLRYAGDNDELYFRDYLNEHYGIAQEYEELKRKLWKQYEHDRDAYTNAKTDFILKNTKCAKQKYGSRYE